MGMDTDTVIAMAKMMSVKVMVMNKIVTTYMVMKLKNMGIATKRKATNMVRVLKKMGIVMARVVVTIMVIAMVKMMEDITIIMLPRKVIRLKMKKKYLSATTTMMILFTNSAN